MNSKIKIMNTTLHSIFLLSIATNAYAARSQEEIEARALENAKANNVKCAGRIKAGLNDCPTSLHACAGMADENNDPEEFIFMPKGTCEKLIGTHIIKIKVKDKKVKTKK